MVWNFPGSGSQQERAVYINFKAIAVFVALAAAVAGGVHFVHLKQVARHTPLVLQEAKKRSAEGEYASALAFYQTYLGYQPDDTEALADLALLKARLAKSRAGAHDAFYSLRRALNLVPERGELRKELVRLGFLRNRLDECKDELEELLDESPNDPEVLLMAARAASQERKFDEARERYETLVSQNSRDVQTELELVSLLFNGLKDIDAADAAMLRALDREEIPAELHAAAATYYFQRNQFDKAEHHVVLALSDPSTASTSLLQLQSVIARMRRRPLELEASLSKLADQAGSDVAMQLELAELEVALGRRLTARQRLAHIGNSDDATPEQLWQVYILSDDYQLSDDLAALREKIVRHDKQGRYVFSLIARDKMRQQSWDAALELSKSLIKDSEAPSHFVATIARWRADCFQQLEQWEDQENSLRTALNVKNSDVLAKSRLARLLFEAGKFQEAQRHYADLIKVSPAYAREFVLLLHAALTGKTRSPLSHQEVDRLFADWRKISSDEPMPVLCELELAQLLKDDEQASRLVSEGLETWPTDVGFRVVQIDRHRREQDWPAVFTCLDEAEAACGSQAALLGRRIVSLTEASPDDLPERMKACAEQFQRMDRDSQADLWPVMMRGLQQAKVDPGSVADLVQEYGEKNPKDSRAQLTFVQRALAAGDLESARKTLGELRQTMGEDSPVVLLANVLYDVKSASLGDQEALARANAGLENLRDGQETTSPLLLVLEADVDLMQRRPQEALSKLKAALLAGENRRSTFVRTLALMAVAGQLNEVVPFVESLASETTAANSPQPEDGDETIDPPSPADFLPQPRDMASLRDALQPEVEKSWPVALAAFRLDLELDHNDQAETTIGQAMSRAPGEPLVWASWLGYLEQHQPERLADEIDEARKNLKVVDQGRVLSKMLLRIGRSDEALQLLDEARKEAPADPDILRSWAQIARQKRSDSLETVLKEALNPTDSQMQPSREVARRELARLWSASTDFPKYREGLSLAEAVALDAEADDMEALMLRAEALAAHPGYWKDAVAALRPLEEANPPSVRFGVFSTEARIQERRKRWEEEQSALIACRDLDPENSQILTRLLLNATRRNDAEAAGAWNAALHAATEDPKIRLNADVLNAKFAKNRSEIVSRVLAAHRQGQVTADLAQEWLALLEADEELESLLKSELDDGRPATISRYLIFLASHDRAADAMPMLSKLWKSGQRDGVLTIAAGMAASPHVTPEILQAIRTTVLKLAASEKTTLKECMVAAALADHAGQYADALSYYETALAKFPESVMALNNVAYLTALNADTPGEESLKRIEQALELNGPLHQLLDTKGVVLFRMGKAQAALDVLEQAWNQRGEMNYLAHLAWAHAELGEADVAAKLFQQVDAAEPPIRLHPLEQLIDAAQRKKAGMAPNDVSPAVSP